MSKNGLFREDLKRNFLFCKPFIKKLTHIFRKMSGFVCFIKKMLLILRNNFETHCYTAVQ